MHKDTIYYLYQSIIYLRKDPDIEMFVAGAAGDIEAVKQHLAAGTDVNVMDEDGWIPFALCDC